MVQHCGTPANGHQLLRQLRRNVCLSEILTGTGQFKSGTEMEALLVKILATALTFSQVTATPHAVKTEFSRDRDQQQVAELLQTGCTHMIKAFEIENINLDDLIDTAMDDPQAF